jgi:hypothetical protein
MQQKRDVCAAMQQKRAAYEAFEKAMLDLYDRELLTLDRLDRVASRYRQLQIGSVGNQHLLTRDGKDLCQVCIELVDPSFPIPVQGSSADHEEYWEQELKKWEDIVRWRWGWHAYDVPGPEQWQREKAA